jgi:2',3'-cyclic-nucleotide 2'-phosphodiesterase (5'-nucleotidase family)
MAEGRNGRLRADQVDLVIASTTDVHGRVRGWDYYADSADGARGLSRAATIVDSLRAAHPGRVILLDAGDLLQGNPFTYAAARMDTLAPHPVIAAMNVMRYDAAAVGNHEFNYGLPVLRRALARARFPFLAANARTPAGARAWPGFVIVRRAGLRVGIVGVTNPGSMVWDRDHLTGHVAISDIVPEVRIAVDSLRAVGVDAVVVVAHAGLSGESSYDTAGTRLGSESPMARVAREVPGIDAIVYGHTHREVADTTINGVLLTQPRNWAASVSVAHLRFDTTGGHARLVSKGATIVRASGHAEQPAVVAAAERGHRAARRYAQQVAGRTESPWRADSARVVATPLMNFVLETMRRAAGSDLASAAAFSLDVAIPAGPVTVAQLSQLYPYDNTLRALRISGAQLKAYLEQSARYFRVRGTGDSLRVDTDPSIPGFNFEMVAGADYTIDLTKPPGQRITGLAVRGRAVADGDSYTIALSNYRAGGAGGYAMLAGAPVSHDRGLEVRQLLIDEIARSGTLRQSDYAARNWRVAPPALAAQAYAALRREPSFDGRAAPSGAVQTGAAAPAAPATTIRLISTNDFHGALEPRPDGNNGLRGGAGQLAAMIHRAEAECGAGCASLLVDGGDEFQGTPSSNLAYGRPVVDLFNALGVAAAALGNHEFDWGQDTLRARMRQAHYGIFGANVRVADGRAVDWIRPDTIVERGGVKVGIIGLASVLTARTTKASNVAGLRFDDPAPVTDARARSLRARGAAVVIVLAHDGAFCTRDAGCRGDVVEFARRLHEPVDAIVSGHTHSLVNTEVNGIPIVQAQSSGRAIAVIDLPVVRGSAAARHEIRTVVTGSIAPDPAADALARTAVQAVASQVGRPIVTVPATMRREGSQYALGNLIADAQRAAALADIAVMNNGGIRANLNAGPASYGSFFEVQPFANLLVRLTVRGQPLRAYLEALVARGDPRAHLSGAVVRYDATKPAGSRIVEAAIGGAALDDDRIYTLAFTDFLATGGDGLTLANGALKQESLGIIDLDALVAFAARAPGGVLQGDDQPRLIRVSP